MMYVLIQDKIYLNVNVIIVNIGRYLSDTSHDCLFENNPTRIFYESDFIILSVT